MTYKYSHTRTHTHIHVYIQHITTVATTPIKFRKQNVLKIYEFVKFDSFILNRYMSICQYINQCIDMIKLLYVYMEIYQYIEKEKIFSSQRRANPVLSLHNIFQLLIQLRRSLKVSGILKITLTSMIDLL